MTKQSSLQKVTFQNDKGETVHQFVDQDGMIIDEIIEKRSWVRSSDYAEEEEEYGQEESLGRNPEHIKLYRTNIQYILAKENLSKDARCVFLSCIAYLDWNSNFVVDPRTHEPLNGKEIGDRTNLDKNVVSRGLQELKSRGIIAVVTSGSSKNAKHYIVHPSLAWKGRRVAKDIAQVKHFAKNGLKLPMEVKYSQGIKRS